MFIEGNIRTDRSKLLEEKYIELINKGTDSDKILVLTLNAYKKERFIKTIKENLHNICLGKLNIYTFSGLVYNSVLDNWAEIENKIPDPNAKIIPNLCGLQVSEYLFKESIKKSGFKDYMSKVNLLHQLFRRFSLITLNMLDDKEIERRSAILKETFNKDAALAINDFKANTLYRRSFDYQRQLAILPYIIDNTDYFKNFEYLIVDDADEISYLEFYFIKSILSGVKDFWIGYDKDGASRIGFLGTYKNAISELKNIAGEKTNLMTDNSPATKLATYVYNGIQADSKIKQNEIEFLSQTKRLDMIDSALNKINLLLKEGVKAEEITIVTPLTNDTLKFALKETFDKNNIKYQILSGNEKLVDYPKIKSIFTLIKLTNPDWKVDIEISDIKSLFINLLDIPVKNIYQVAINYKKEKKLTDFDFGKVKFNDKYKNLLSVIKELKEKDFNLSKSVLYIFENLIQKDVSEKEVGKISFLIKEIEGFENAFSSLSEQNKKEIIIQLENSIISENPPVQETIEAKSIIVATPQKIVDIGLKSRYSFWLDISNSEWQKQDTGTLYNSWVFSRDYEKDSFDFNDSLELQKDKSARILRKIVLSADKITAFSSLYDEMGNENTGGIEEFFELNTQAASTPKKIFSPREDQKPVLKYKNGKMGIMAVPGAGKTTILLELIAKLLKTEKAENIFVLTYMESAARNLKERIKTNYPEYNELPNISTIHGLALRILKENSNFVKAGLSEGFEICDDSERQRVIIETLLRLKINQDSYDDYQKAISALKLSAESFPMCSQYKEIQDFLNFYKAYNKALREYNLIDYDDMLGLSVKILEENKDILDYYQDICHFVIEDEAQDSSKIQQKLLLFLSGKHNNLVRCGDINQSITGTFTSADPIDFKKFIEKNEPVEMNSSQRCAKPIYELANRLIKEVSNNLLLQNAFYKIEMQGTEKNPKSKTPVTYNIFEEENDEKSFITKKIKELLVKNPETNIAILLRNNYQIVDYSKYLSNLGLAPSSRSDLLSQKKVFKVIFSLLKICASSWNNKVLVAEAENLKQTKTINLTDEDLEFIKGLKTPFINIDTKELLTEGLLALYWDVNYWISNSNFELQDLAVKIGNYYFDTNIEKSNVHLIATIIKKLSSTYKTSETLLEKLEELSKRPIGSSYKFFSQEDENTNITGEITLMTVHKSKGDEFDVVFIPELTEDNFPSEPENLKVKTNTHFIETIKNLIPSYKRKSQEELKSEQVEESLRLLYVGITRAKSELYLTCSNKYKKKRQTTPNKLLIKLLEGKNE